MRAFFSIPIPDAFRRSIRVLAEGLRADTTMQARWVAQANYHITLQYLGDIDPSLTGALEELCTSLARELPPFVCLLDRIDAFPNADRARVIWVGGQAPPKFRELSQALSSGLENLGFPKPRTESLVHVTLARVKGHPDPGLSKVIAKVGPIEPMPILVNEIHLMESNLTPQGAVYLPVFSVALSRPEDES